VVHIPGFTQALHHLDPKDVGIEELATTVRALACECQQRWQYDRAWVRIGRPVNVVEIKGVPGSPIDHLCKWRIQLVGSPDQYRLAGAPRSYSFGCIFCDGAICASEHARDCVDGCIA
jgi:hypothetical protein